MVGQTQYTQSVAETTKSARPRFYQNKYRNNHTDHKFYQGIEASVKYMSPTSVNGNQAKVSGVLSSIS